MLLASAINSSLKLLLPRIEYPSESTRLERKDSRVEASSSVILRARGFSTIFGAVILIVDSL